jgi:hypothetical protein
MPAVELHTCVEYMYMCVRVCARVCMIKGGGMFDNKA